MAEAAFKEIEACVFDAYGTLFDVHSAIARGGRSLGERAQAVSDLWRQKQLEYTWLRSLMRAHVDFWQVTGDGLDYALAAHAIEDPAVKDTLARLSGAGLATAILSNGSPAMLEAAVSSAGLAELLGSVLSVEEVGIFKPDPSVYQLAVDRLAVRPEQVCFLSSNAWDAAAAAHFGFRVAWVNRFGKERERIPADPAAVIKDLSELPALLGL
jgi:2-haloacid dehalogenase